jgi:NTP pyrophosphatase (non-canonical NTP hydrolase)
VSETQQSISQWADETFGPVKNPITSITRINKEVAEILHEMAAHPNYFPEEELADIAIVLYRVATVAGVDLHACIDEKMKINRNRRWRLDGSGHAQHID